MLAIEANFFQGNIGVIALVLSALEVHFERRYQSSEEGARHCGYRGASVVSPLAQGRAWGRLGTQPLSGGCRRCAARERQSSGSA